MDENEEFVVSYETLFDLLKRERDRSELQKLDKNFFIEVVNFLDSKTKDLEKSSLEHKRGLERQLENVKRLLTDLYSKREKKIVGLALDKSKTKSVIVDNTVFLPEEKIFFEAVVALLTHYREGILGNVLICNNPDINEVFNDIGSLDPQKKPQIDEKKDEDVILVRFVQAVPKFVGEELEEYGPFEEEDIANIPRILAKVLIDKGRAEEIKSN